MVFQNYALYPHMTVAENLGFGLTLRGHKQADIDQRVAAAAKTLELETRLLSGPGALSGGQRQHGAPGRALVSEPGDRKSAVTGQSGSGRTDVGGSRSITNTRQTATQAPNESGRETR